MAAGHDHTDANGHDVTHLLLCELFDPETPQGRREEIHRAVSHCPDCQSQVESEHAVRAIVRDCCAPARAPEPLRERIIASITYTSITEVRFR